MNLKSQISNLPLNVLAVLVSVLCLPVMTRGEATAVAQPPAIQVGEEIVVMAAGPGKELRGGQSVAAGKDDLYLAVWREGWTGKGGKSRIYAARIAADGKLLDPNGIEVAAGAGGAQDRPRAAFCGNAFLVVWQDFSNGTDMDVLGARVGLDGKVLDAKPITIAAGPRTQVLPEIASNGTDGFLVVWQGFQGKEDACRSFAVRVGADGVVGQPVTLDVSPMPKVAWDGKRFLVAYGPLGTFDTIKTKRITADGKLDGNGVEDGSVTYTASPSGLYSLSAMPGKGWVIVKDRAVPDFWGWGGPGAMRCYGILEDGSSDKAQKREVTNPGYKLEPNWLEACTGKGKANTWPYGRSAVAWDGKQGVAVWARQHFGGPQGISLVNGDIMAGRIIGADWSLPDAKQPVSVATTPGDEQNPALASNGNAKLICVYEKKTDDGNTQVCARMLETK